MCRRPGAPEIARKRPRMQVAIALAVDPRDYGPNIRRKAVRSRSGLLLREADVTVEEGPDPNDPKIKVRRARRTDPLRRLLDTNSITKRQYDAAEVLRGHIEDAEPNMGGGAVGGCSTSPFTRIPVTSGMLWARDRQREGLAAVAAADRLTLCWLIAGGSIGGFCIYGRRSHHWVTASLRRALDALADLYLGREQRP